MSEDWLKKGLPVFHGIKDKSSARSLIERLGGAGGGIKKAYQTNMDGSTTMAHLRGSSRPEVTVIAAAEQSCVAKWAWPWHGVYRSLDNKIEVGAIDVDAYGAYPQRHNYNFLPHTEGGAFGSILAPKKRNPVGATWVNWAAVSGGVLFGEFVGANTWLYTADQKCWVVSMSIENTAATLRFYTLDNWVAGCAVSLATNYVPYDRAPTPYMVKDLPSGAARVVVKTLVVALPAYWRGSDTYITRKRSDVSRTGAKIIIAYEGRGSAAGTVEIPSPSKSGECFQIENQWVELTISGASSDDLSATAETIYSGAEITPMMRNTHVVINTNEDDPPPKYTFVGVATITATREYSYRIGVMYDQSDNAVPVTVSFSETINEVINYTQTTVPSSAACNRSTVVTNEYLFTVGEVTTAVSSSHTSNDILDMVGSTIGTNIGTTDWSVSTAGRVFSGTFTGPSRYGETPWSTQPQWVYAVNPNTGISVVVPGGNYGARRIPSTVWTGKIRFWFNKTNDSWADDPQTTLAAVAQYNSYTVPPKNTPAMPHEIGLKRYFPFMCEIGGYSGSSSSLSTTYQIRVARVAFNCFVIEMVVFTGGMMSTGGVEPLVFISPLGVLAVAEGDVSPTPTASHMLDVAYNKVSHTVTYAVADELRQYV